MGNYSDVDGMISYDVIEDETIEKIENFLTGEEIIDRINEERGGNRRPVTSSLFGNFSRVNAYDIFIDFTEYKAYDLKDEITVIVKFLNDIGVTGITVDIDREGENGPGDNEHFKLDDNGNVVSAIAKIVYEDYS